MVDSPSYQDINFGKKELEAALSSDDERRICLAHAALGSAYFLDRNLARGRHHFSEADKLVEKLGDLSLEVEYLKIKSFAQQLAGHLPDAYKSAERLFVIGQQTGNPGLMSDALASQGQTQLDSGDPVKANEKFQHALELAREMNDRRRMMNLYGAGGNLSMSIAAADSALKDFYQARNLAEELDDRRAEIGYSGNIGTVLSFQGKHIQAIEEFEKILMYVKDQDDIDAQIQALRYLCRSHSAVGNHQEASAYAKQGISLSAKKDKETRIFFYEKLITSIYNLGNLEEARHYTQEAIDIAATLKDKSKQVELLIGLGESFTLSNLFPQALEVYERARDLAVRLQQRKNEAYLVGRIGMALAESGEVDKAIHHHQRAVSLARDLKLPDLEGQQLTLLAMAYQDKLDYSNALDHASQALEVFMAANLLDESEKVRGLIKTLKAQQAA